MPRIALVCVCLVGGCFFDAQYRSGDVHCGDGKCPSGLSCNADHVCVEHLDGGVDVMPDVPDAPPPALTCSQPGMFPTTGGSMSETTAGRMNHLAVQCNTGVMNGLDAVYSIALPSGKQVTLSVSTTTSGYQVAAYMIAPCSASTCLGSAYATAGSPVTITTTTTTPQFIVVDSIFAGAGGQYTLDVSVN